MYEHKFAQTDAGINPLVRQRWSPRSFSAQQISSGDLKTVLEAGRWAASSRNEQPWRFIVGRRGTPSFEKILSLLVPPNQAWAKKASVLMVIAARTKMGNGSPNRYHLHDAGAAAAHILLQATGCGFGGHAMAGFDYERAKKELNFPPEYEPGAAIALGYIAAPEELELDESYVQMERSPRQRLPLSELVFEGDWGVKPDLEHF